MISETSIIMNSQLLKMLLHSLDLKRDEEPFTSLEETLEMILKTQISDVESETHLDQLL
jgi:hypothetical protein